MVDSFRTVSVYNLQNTLYRGTKFLDEGNGILDFVYLKNTLESYYFHDKNKLSIVNINSL